MSRRYDGSSAALPDAVIDELDAEFAALSRELAVLSETPPIWALVRTHSAVPAPGLRSTTAAATPSWRPSRRHRGAVERPLGESSSALCESPDDGRSPNVPTLFAGPGTPGRRRNWALVARISLPGVAGATLDELGRARWGELTPRVATNLASRLASSSG